MLSVDEYARDDFSQLVIIELWKQGTAHFFKLPAGLSGFCCDGLLRLPLQLLSELLRQLEC